LAGTDNTTQTHGEKKSGEMAPNASSSAIKTLVRVTAFGLGAAYGGHRLAYLKQKKKEEDEERARKEFNERVEKIIEERERQKEHASRPVVAATGSSSWPSDEGEYLEKWLELLESDPSFDIVSVA